MKYRHTKDNRVMEVIKEDTDRKTYLIKFEDGTSTTIAHSTFKRWWKPIDEDDEYVAEIMEQKKQLGIECPPIESIQIVSDDRCEDGRTYAEIGKEIAEQAKAKAEKAKKVKAEKVAYSEDTVAADIIRAASLYVTPKSKHDLVLKDDDKNMLAVVYVGKKSLTFYFNGEDIKEKLIAGGAEIVESSEKFDYYSKIDINTLISVLPMLTA